MSRAVPAPARRSRRLLAPILVALVVLGGCAHTRQEPERYGDTTRNNFNEGCVASLTADGGEGEALTTKDATAVCKCSYSAISGADGISFDEFKRINDAQEEEPTELPDEIQDIVARCREDKGPAPQ